MATTKLKELEPYQAPDCNAPRKRKKLHDIVNNDFVKALKKEYPQVKGIHIRDIKKLVKDFNEKKIVEYILNNRDPLHLPHMLGVMVVAVYGKANTIDRGLSTKLEKRVHYRSNHSNGYGAAIYYTTSHIYTKTIVSRHMWWFYPCTNAKDKLAEKMLDGESWRMYMYMKNKNHIRGNIKQLLRPSAYKPYKKREFDSYNELDITIDE